MFLPGPDVRGVVEKPFKNDGLSTFFRDLVMRVRFAKYGLFLRLGGSHILYQAYPKVLSSSEVWGLGAERLGYFKASNCLFWKSGSFAANPL